ncbi:hypothetical protein BHE74_00028678 [Ensete ventricosum]|nr:hypothetical protein BHE74_00028678 [Ensete ventricosum]
MAVVETAEVSPYLILLILIFFCAPCVRELIDRSRFRESKGAESTVYEARLRDGTRVAAKKPVLSTADDIDHFHRQLQLLCKLDHPGLAKLVAANARPPNYLLFFEHYESRSLAEKLHVEEWSPIVDQVIAIAYDLGAHPLWSFICDLGLLTYFSIELLTGVVPYTDLRAEAQDHVASCPEERMRVMGEGVEVKWQVDTWRVGPAALQVTRSIGDDDLKPAVTANPEIIVTCISADDDFLVSFGWLLSYEFSISSCTAQYRWYVLVRQDTGTRTARYQAVLSKPESPWAGTRRRLVMASDGLWDVISNEEVVSIIKDTVKEPSMCSKRLATEAAARGSKDNITVIVVFLRPVSTAERIY